MTLDELRARATIKRQGYRVFDGEYALMSVTLEDAEFLYALVRLVRPKVVLELGTGYGVASRFIVEALRENGKGRLWTVESNHAFADASLPVLDDVLEWVELEREVPSGLGPDLILIDSDYKRREQDIAYWLAPPKTRRPLVVLHDAARGYVLHGAIGVELPGIDGLWLGRAA